MRREKFALCVWLARYIQRKINNTLGIKTPSVHEVMQLTGLGMSEAIKWREEIYGPTISGERIMVHIRDSRVDITSELSFIVETNSKVSRFTDIVFLDTASIDVDSALCDADELFKKLLKGATF